MADTTAPQAPQQDTGVFGTLKKWSDEFVVGVVNFGRSREAKATTVTPTTSVDDGTIPAQGESATQYTSTVLPPRAEQPAPAKPSAAQEAYAKTEAAIIEQVAIGLKTNGNIVDMALLGGAVIEPPQSDAEYRRIAKELIENRKFKIKDSLGNETEVSIDKMDETLAKMAKDQDPEAKAFYDKTIKNLGAKSFNEKIPDASRRSKIAQAVSDSVEENTGTLPFLGGASFMNALMGLFQWIMSGFEGGFDGLKSNIANVTADNTSKSVEGKLRALGESQENIQTISDGVRNAALEKAGYPNKDAKKPTKLEDIKAAPLSTQQPEAAPSSPSLGTPAPTVIPPAVPSPTPSVEASPDITITAGAAAALAAGTLERQREREKSAAQEPTVSPTQAQNTATTSNEKLNRTVAGIAEKLIPKGIENREGLVKDTTVILAGIVEKNKNLINNPTELGKIAAKELLDPTTNKGNPETPEGRVATALSNSARKEGVTTLEGALKGIERLEIYPVMFPDLETGKPKLITPGKVLHEGYEGLEKIIGKQFAENSKGLQEAAGVVTTTSTKAATITVPAVPAPAQVPTTTASTTQHVTPPVKTQESAQVPTTATSKPTVPVVPIAPKPVELAPSPPVPAPTVPARSPEHPHKDERKKTEKPRVTRDPTNTANNPASSHAPTPTVAPPAPQPAVQQPAQTTEAPLKKAVTEIIGDMMKAEAKKDKKAPPTQEAIDDASLVTYNTLQQNKHLLKSGDSRGLGALISNELMKDEKVLTRLRENTPFIVKILPLSQPQKDDLIKSGYKSEKGLEERVRNLLVESIPTLQKAAAIQEAALGSKPIQMAGIPTDGPTGPPTTYTQPKTNTQTALR